MLELFNREIKGRSRKFSQVNWDNDSFEVGLKERLFQHLEHSNQKITLTDKYGVNVPPYACKFCTVPGKENICLVVDEEGYVSVVDTQLLDIVGSNGISSNLCIKEKWNTHYNAVFDVTWVPHSERFVTASGDTTAVLWDVTRPNVKLGVFRGHSCSLKSVSVSENNPYLLATGSRDGNVLVWDYRCSTNEVSQCQPVLRIQSAHAIYDALTPQRKRRRRSTANPNNQLLVDSRQTVTSVIFQDSTTLISSGAMDGTVKLWDVRKIACGSSRKNSKSNRKHTTPKECILYPGSSDRRRGYNTLTLDSTGTRLFASCTDNTIYEYDLSGASTNRTPSNRYTGHYSSSFYNRIALSPDDLFLLSGCDDDMAFIWKTTRAGAVPVSPSFRLKSAGMAQVTAVTWSPKDFTRLLTCSDDCAVRLWKVPELGSKSSHQKDGYCEVVGATRETDSQPTSQNSGQQSPVGFFRRSSFDASVVESSPPPLRGASPNSRNTAEGLKHKRPAANSEKPKVSIKKWLVPASPSSSQESKSQRDDDKENEQSQTDSFAAGENVVSANSTSPMRESARVGNTGSAVLSRRVTPAKLPRSPHCVAPNSKSAVKHSDWKKPRYSIMTYFTTKMG